MAGSGGNWRLRGNQLLFPPLDKRNALGNSREFGGGRVMRLGNRKTWLGLLAVSVMCGVGALASIDYPGPPTWSLVKPEYDPAGSAAMLLPSNDTRVNLYLLLADRRGAKVRDPKAKQENPPLILFPWATLAAAMEPAQGEAPAAQPEPQTQCETNADGSTVCSAEAESEPTAQTWSEPSRCDSNETGAAEFIAAVNASGNVPATEKNMLIDARQRIAPAVRTVRPGTDGEDCGTGSIAGLDLGKFTSVEARDFASYVYAAQSFYDGDFNLAVERFRNLAARPNPWVREAAFYMVGRSELNLALSRSVNEYGELDDATKRDRASAIAAAAGFDAYLKAYPAGRYASSARGLLRRAHWLAGETAALAHDYGAQIARNGPLDGAESDIDLVQEVDQKLPLPTDNPQAIRDPVLLAVVDLHRMRQPGETYSGENEDRSFCCGPAITKAEIERQRPLFGNDTELYDYVRAAEAYFVRHQPREVLALIPDAAHQPRFSYLQFSRQMLRGMALQDVGDRNVRAFLLTLFPGAVQPYQRGAVELALATQEEKSGRLGLVFAPGSEVRHPIIRQLLLEHVAGPELLRQQASSSDVRKTEREAALYILLTKELRNGMYRPFLGDVRLVPSDAPKDSWYEDAASYEPEWWASDQEQQRPPLGKFRAPEFGRSGCPPLDAIAAQLAGKPDDIHARLCLAEFFRDNGFDGFSSYESPASGNGLASTRSLFPLQNYSRLEVYKAIMNDGAASPDDRAFALNRAVRCYAPGGNNSCDGKEVSLAVRRGWYNRLKAQYPQSRWAKDLDYYW